jgi:hypothetical protein
MTAGLAIVTAYRSPHIEQNDEDRSDYEHQYWTLQFGSGAAYVARSHCAAETSLRDRARLRILKAVAPLADNTQ